MRTIIHTPIVLLALAFSVANAQVAQQSTDQTKTLQVTSTSTAAKALFWNGLDHWQNFGYSTAQQHFDSAVSLDPTFGLARVFAAEAAVMRGFPRKQAELDRGVADAARASTAEGIIALAWREKAAGHDSAVAALLRTAITLLPNEPRLVSEYVWSLASVDMKGALAAGRDARRKYPFFAPLSPALSYTQMQTGDTAAAFAEAEHYTQLDPNHPATFVYYGRLLQSVGRYAEAEAQYRRSLTLLPLHADVPYNGELALAELLVLESKPAAARQVISNALQRVTSKLDSLTYLLPLGGTQLFEMDVRGALRSYADVSRLSPITEGYAGFNYGWLFSALTDAVFGDGRSVPKYMASFGNVSPKDSVPMAFSLAGIYAYAGLADSTFKYANRLAGVAPTNPIAGQAAHLTRGEVYLQTHNCEKALAEFRQADSTWVEVQAGSAECEMALGHRDAALQWRSRALSHRDLNLSDPGEVHARMRMLEWK